MGLKFKCCSGIEMSPMEKMLYDELRLKNIKFHQEVTFSSCRNPKTGMLLRYDFYIPSKNLLIEYDGKAYHQDIEVQYRDSIKDTFAHKNKVTLIRLTGKAAVKKFIATLESYQKKPTTPPKPKKVKEKKKYVDTKVYESAIERYEKGLQKPTMPKYVERKLRKEENKAKAQAKQEKKKKEISTWQPVPYKRIALL